MAFWGFFFLHGLRDLSSWTRERIRILGSEKCQVLTTGPPRNSLSLYFCVDTKKKAHLTVLSNYCAQA